MVFSSPFLFSVVGISSFTIFLLILTEILYYLSMSFLFALWKQMHFGRSSAKIGMQICRSQIILHLLNILGQLSSPTPPHIGPFSILKRILNTLNPSWLPHIISKIKVMKIQGSVSLIVWVSETPLRQLILIKIFVFYLSTFVRYNLMFYIKYVLFHLILSSNQPSMLVLYSLYI